MSKGSPTSFFLLWSFLHWRQGLVASSIIILHPLILSENFIPIWLWVGISYFCILFYVTFFVENWFVQQLRIHSLLRCIHGKDLWIIFCNLFILGPFHDACFCETGHLSQSVEICQKYWNFLPDNHTGFRRDFFKKMSYWIRTFGNQMRSDLGFVRAHPASANEDCNGIASCTTTRILNRYCALRGQKNILRG